MSNDFGFDELEKKFENLAKRFPKEIEKKLGNIADEVVAEAQSNTPVDTGNLRRSIGRSSVTREGNEFIVEVGTNIDYAQYVEYGHKTRSGGLIKGKFMILNAIIKKEKELDDDLGVFIKEKTEELDL